MSLRREDRIRLIGPLALNSFCVIATASDQRFLVAAACPLLPFRRGYAAGPFDAINREVRVRIHFLQILRMLFDKIGQETRRSVDGRRNVIEEPGDNVSRTDIAEVLPNVLIRVHPVISGGAATGEKSQNSRPPKDEPVVGIGLRTDEIEQGASLGIFNSVERTVIHL